MIAKILHLKVWKIIFYVLKFCFSNKISLFLSDLLMWRLNDKLECWHVFFIIFFYSKISPPKGQRSKESTTAQAQNIKHRSSYNTELIPKMPNPHLLSCKFIPLAASLMALDQVQGGGDAHDEFLKHPQLSQYMI